MQYSRQRGAIAAQILIPVCIVAAFAGAFYALFMLTKLTNELGRMVAKLNSLDTMCTDMKHLSARLSLLEETNRKLSRMEISMRDMRVLAKVGKAALTESTSTNLKLNTTNASLADTNELLGQTTKMLNRTNTNLEYMHSSLARMGNSIDQMSKQMLALNDMRGLIVETNSNLGDTREGINKVTGGLDKIGGGLDNLGNGITKMSSGMDVVQSKLIDIDSKFDVLPQMKLGLDKTNETLSSVVSTFQPLGQTLPLLNTSLHQLNITTMDMSRSLKKLPKQGALGVAILTAAELMR